MNVTTNDIDLQELCGQLDFAATECHKLKIILRSFQPETIFKQNLDIYQPSQLGQSRSDDNSNCNEELDQELELVDSLLQTLRFHLEEIEHSNASGDSRWRRSLSGLSSTLRACCTEMLMLLSGNQYGVRSTRYSTSRLADLRQLLRDLRLKLSTAIAIVSLYVTKVAISLLFKLICVSCASRISFNSQPDYLHTINERLQLLLETVENEQTSRLNPGLPLYSANLEGIESAQSLILRRYLAKSIEEDWETIRAASI